LVAAALVAAGPVSAEERHDAPTAQMPGVITKGSGDTSIGGLPAARKGDTTDRGDTLEQGSPNVFINGRPADARAALELRQGGGPDVAPTHVPAGYVFAMGDFRGNSRDSRFFGFVREDQIYARAMRVYYRSGEGFVWKPL